MRCVREKIIDKEAAIKKLNELHTNSSLFITKNLIEEAVKSINKYKCSYLQFL